MIKPSTSERQLATVAYSKLGLSISILAAITILLSPLWLPAIGTFLVVSDPLRKADALVVLAGDENERIAYGAHLFQNGYAEWFILTNMRLDVSKSPGAYSKVVRRKAIKQGVPERRILIIDSTVATTYEEAVRVMEFAHRQNLESLIIVTSPYHTRRARWIFNQVFRESEVQLTIQPALNYPYQSKGWWKNPVGRYVTAMEYLKFCAHLLGFRHFEQFSRSLSSGLMEFNDSIQPWKNQQ